jgi:hypothetical protein
MNIYYFFDFLRNCENDDQRRRMALNRSSDTDDPPRKRRSLFWRGSLCRQKMSALSVNSGSAMQENGQSFPRLKM